MTTLTRLPGWTTVPAIGLVCNTTPAARWLDSS